MGRVLYIIPPQLPPIIPIYGDGSIKIPFLFQDPGSKEILFFTVKKIPKNILYLQDRNDVVIFTEKPLIICEDWILCGKKEPIHMYLSPVTHYTRMHLLLLGYEFYKHIYDHSDVYKPRYAHFKDLVLEGVMYFPDFHELSYIYNFLDNNQRRKCIAISGVQ